LMDCQMPVLDGYAATREIRAFESQSSLNSTPIIAITAGSDELDQKRCLEAGMNDYINKPFSLSDIKTIIDTYIEPVQSSGSQTSPEIKAQLKPGALETVEFTEEQEAEYDVLNISAIESIKDIERQTGRRILPSIFSGYNEQMSEKIVELKQHLETGDSILLYKTAHAIKSMSANIGAERVRHIGSFIEKRGREGDIAELQAIVKQLVDAYEEFNREFNSVLVE